MQPQMYHSVLPPIGLSQRDRVTKTLAPVPATAAPATSRQLVTNRLLSRQSPGIQHEGRGGGGAVHRRDKSTSTAAASISADAPQRACRGYVAEGVYPVPRFPGRSRAPPASSPIDLIASRLALFVTCEEGCRCPIRR